MVFCQSAAAGSFLQRAFRFLYTDLRLYRLFQRYFYQILLRRLYYTASDLKRCKRSLVQSVYLYFDSFDPRASKSAFIILSRSLPEIIFTAVTTLLVYRLFLSASRRLEDIGKEIPPLFDELLEVTREFLKKLITSRLLPWQLYLPSCLPV